MTVVSHTSLSVREFRGKLRAEQHETGRKRRSRLNQRPVHLSTNSHVPSESRVKMCLEPTAKSKYSKDFNFLFLITPTPGQEEWKGTYPPWWTSRLHEGRVLPPFESLGMAEASGVRLSAGLITDEHEAHKEPTTAPSTTKSCGTVEAECGIEKS